MADSVQGTWGVGNFKLPDFGLTELLSTAMGNTSNPTFNNPAVYQATGGQGVTSLSPNYGTQSNVLGNNTLSSGIQNITPPAAGGGGGDSALQSLAKIGNRNPIQESEYQRMLAQQGSQGIDEGAINAVYEPTMNYLNTAEQQVRGDLPNVLDAAQKSYETAIAELTANKTKNQTTIAENTVQAGQRKEDALSSARRLYDELRRGYGQRFGGASSAGQAASELSSVEQQRQMGQTTRDFGTTMRQIDQQKVQLDQEYQTGTAKIQEQKTMALQQAQQNFTQALLQIQSQRASTEGAKAAAKLDALNVLKQQAYATQQQALSYQQSLDMFYKQQQADVQSYAQKLALAGQGSTAAASLFNQSTTTNPTTNAIVGSQTGTQGTQPTGQTTGSSMKWDGTKWVTA